MITALLSGIALMYFVLVIQFNSFSAPLAVMLSLPSASSAWWWR